MRRIGILTIQSANNYGCVLQCMALRTKIAEIFPEDCVEVINYVMPGSRRTLSANETDLIQREENFSEFRKKYFNKNIAEFEDIDIFNHLPYDVYVVGSDQVWNYYLAHKADDVFFLDMIESDKKKISYAASTGGIDFNEEISNWIQRGLKGFSEISLREQSSVRTLSQILNRVINHCVDPTMLFDADYWEKIERKPKGLGDKPYIFMYGLGYAWCKVEEEQACKMTNDIAEEYGLDIIHYYYGDYKKRFPESAKCCYFNSPEEFLWLVHHSAYMIVCSFHGTVFSTIFERPFYTFKLGNNGARMKDLTEMLNIGDRYIDSPLDKDEWNWDIDWITVKKQLELNRQASIEYLRRALDD